MTRRRARSVVEEMATLPPAPSIDHVFVQAVGGNAVSHPDGRPLAPGGEWVARGDAANRLYWDRRLYFYEISMTFPAADQVARADTEGAAA